MQEILLLQIVHMPHFNIHFIEELRETHNFEFSSIYLQECQFNENYDVTQFKLDNYILIPQGIPKTPCSTKGA